MIKTKTSRRAKAARAARVLCLLVLARTGKARGDEPVAPVGWAQAVRTTQATGSPTVLVVTSSATSGSRELYHSLATSPAIVGLRGRVILAELSADIDPDQVDHLGLSSPSVVAFRRGRGGALERAGSHSGPISPDGLAAWLKDRGLITAEVTPPRSPVLPTATATTTDPALAQASFGGHHHQPRPSPQVPYSPPAPVPYAPPPTYVPPPPPIREVYIEQQPVEREIVIEREVAPPTVTREIVVERAAPPTTREIVVERAAPPTTRSLLTRPREAPAPPTTREIVVEREAPVTRRVVERAAPPTTREIVVERAAPTTREVVVEREAPATREVVVERAAPARRVVAREADVQPELNFVRPGPFDRALGALGTRLRRRGLPRVNVEVETQQTYLVVPPQAAPRVIAAQAPPYYEAPRQPPVTYPSLPPPPPHAPTPQHAPPPMYPAPTPQAPGM